MHELLVTQSTHYAPEEKEDSIDLIITNITEHDAGTYICQLVVGLTNSIPDLP